ncbi:flavin reductase family protein [Aliibacillus thermotolerans]|uniref:Flavin reductase family protein n=1 Tax=Aliibacillus thermotolerans TaxID=1834418 RepID=A0ABW0U9K8_9BACI|nr:flavin reductase family protein [Aliibacillus thermotolerans]MDA3129740.1 flavin reductase [Aliibacillus thermotolerans]
MDDQLFKKAMSKFTTGVTVITTKDQDGVHGMTANAFMSVSLDPKLVLISVHENARMNKRIEQSQKFAVSILADDQQEMSMYFAGQLKEERDIEFEEFNGYPVIPDAVVNITCDVHNAHVEGDHTLYVGAVTDIKINDKDPLTLYSGQYGDFKAVTSS